MKYNSDYFFQVSRVLFDEKFNMLSHNAKWLYVVLCHLEHKFTSGKPDDFFTRSDDQLSIDANMSKSTTKRAKTELKKTDLIETWQYHFKNNNNKKSTIHYTAYKIKHWDFYARLDM